jgi:hypothetical protein
MPIASLLLCALQVAAPAPPSSPEDWTELTRGEPFVLELLGRHPLRFGAGDAAPEELESWGGIGIDRAGRALVQAEEVGAVHVFDAEGRELLVCRPPTATRAYWLDFVAVDGRGRVIAQRSYRGPADLYDEQGVWIATGTPAGVKEDELYPLFIAALPGAEGFWVHRSAMGLLRIREGRTLHALPAHPDGSHWRTPIFAVRGSGGLTVIDGPLESWGMDLPPPPPDPDPREHLFVYDAQGELRRSLVLPSALARSFRAGTELVVFLGTESTYDALDVLDLRTGLLRRASSRIELKARDAWEVVEREGRAELWRIFHRERALLRFALPGGKPR